MKTKIVIADDHPIVLAGVRDVMERDPRFQLVGEARSPAALVELLEQHAPDIAITDYNMPGDDTLGDGIKLISFLNRKFPECKLLILTMVSSPPIISAMYRAGASGVVRKTGDLKELQTALSALLGQRIYRSPDLLLEDIELVHNTSPDPAQLSPREFEVIRLFVSGQSVGEIAKGLNRSGKTVSTQKVSAMRKLGARTDQELISYCLESGMFN